MPGYKLRYPQQRDPADEARKQAIAQRQEQASAYAAAKFQEWQANAGEREQALQLRLQNLESEAELKGAEFRYNYWKDQELRKQTAAYYTAMPVLQEQLKQAGIYPGNPRYAAEMASFAAEIPDAVTHNQAIREDLKNFTKVDLTAGQIADRVQTLKEGMQQANQRLGNVRLTQGGEITGEASPVLPEKVLMRYGKLVGDIEEYGQSDKARVAAAQKEKAIFEAQYPDLQKLLPTTPATPTPGPNILQRAAASLGKVFESPSQTPTPTTTPTPAMVAPNHQAALDWANANPDDPRAQQILQLNGTTQ